MLTSIQKSLQIAGILLIFDLLTYPAIFRLFMKILFKNPAQIITVDTSGKNIKRGNDANELKPLSNHSILTENGIIIDFIPDSSLSKISADSTVNLNGLLVLPGLIDCHTHPHTPDHARKNSLPYLKGATYEEIAGAGGGITSTMKAVRSSSYDELIRLLKPRVDYFISQGITTLEIKSGYGLSFYDEINFCR